MSENITKEEFKFRLETYKLIEESNVLILNQAHLTFPAREDSIENIGFGSFNQCVVTRTQLHQADLIIYADSEGTKVIKSRFTTNELLNIMSYLGIPSFINGTTKPDIYDELRKMGLTHDQCSNVKEFINTL